MELKEIFNHEERRLYPEVADLAARYAKLRDRFARFVACFPPEAGHFPKEMEFEADAKKPLLTVRYCGKEFRFCFDMVGHQGQVRCLVSSSNEADEDSEEEEPLELGKFTFNGQGQTNIVPAGSRDGDVLDIDETRPAYGIVASFLVAAFKE